MYTFMSFAKKNCMEKEPEEVYLIQRGKTVGGFSMDSEYRFGELLWQYKKQTEKCSLCSVGRQHVVKRLKEQLETFDFTQAKLCNRKDREAGD